MMLIKKITFSLFLLVLLALTAMTVLGQSYSQVYYMDNNPQRVIELGPLPWPEIHWVQENTSPWPWSGAMIVMSNRYYGIARFQNKLSTMMLYGTPSNNGISMSYIFLTDDYGNLLQRIGLGGGRIDNHEWFRVR